MEIPETRFIFFVVLAFFSSSTEAQQQSRGDECAKRSPTDEDKRVLKANIAVKALMIGSHPDENESNLAFVGEFWILDVYKGSDKLSAALQVSSDVFHLKDKYVFRVWCVRGMDKRKLFSCHTKLFSYEIGRVVGCVCVFGGEIGVRINFGSDIFSLAIPGFSNKVVFFFSLCMIEANLSRLTVNGRSERRSIWPSLFLSFLGTDLFCLFQVES